MCPKAGRPQGSEFFLLQEEVIDKARCHQVYETRADHLEERDEPFLLREDHRLATIVSSLARISVDEREASQKFRVILK